MVAVCFAGRSCKGLGQSGADLYYRQRYTVNLLVNIESINVCHATDIVEYSHDAGLQVIASDFILTAESVDELFAMELFRVNGRLDEALHLRHQNLQNNVTRCTIATICR